MSMARLCGCAGSSEPSLAAFARGNISCPETTRFVKPDAEACKNQFTSSFVRLCVRVMIHWNHLMCSIFYPIIQFHEHAQIQKVLPEGSNFDGVFLFCFF